MHTSTRRRLAPSRRGAGKSATPLPRLRRFRTSSPHLSSFRRALRLMLRSLARERERSPSIHRRRARTASHGSLGRIRRRRATQLQAPSTRRCRQRQSTLVARTALCRHLTSRTWSRRHSTRIRARIRSRRTPLSLVTGASQSRRLPRTSSSIRARARPLPYRRRPRRRQRPLHFPRRRPCQQAPRRRSRSQVPSRWPRPRPLQFPHPRARPSRARPLL